MSLQANFQSEPPPAIHHTSYKISPCPSFSVSLSFLYTLQGCTSHMACEATWALLSKMILCVNSHVIDPSNRWGFPMMTISLLPYLVHNYENPPQICRDTADRIAQVCGHAGDHLSNLATIMNLYRSDTRQDTRLRLSNQLEISCFSMYFSFVFKKKDCYEKCYKIQ